MHGFSTERLLVQTKTPPEGGVFLVEMVGIEPTSEKFDR